MLVRSESGAPLPLLINLGGWDGEVRLFPAAGLGRVRLPVGGWHHPVARLEISVARDGALGDEMVHEEAARTLVERLLLFLQLRSRHSLFEAIEHYQRLAADPAAASEREALLGMTPQFTRVAGYAERDSMHDYLCEQFSRALCRDLLEDMAVSLAHGRSRRACLELTMACETALGMRLESAALVRSSIGSLFINRHGEAAEQIVQLFQARDAMRQPGDGLFRFVSAARWREIESHLTHWRAAVECLADSLYAMSNSLQEAL